MFRRYSEDSKLMDSLSELISASFTSPLVIPQIYAIHLRPYHGTVQVQIIQDWPEPRKVKDIQSFLSFANFYLTFHLLIL